ncbi:GL15193 [Drosophila persimilis]|uniref:GL15193 n=1 Tax=Drosophila persimilis TaxID=7234 RepID=B4GPU1_DROPE|nr:GL15193 [Drosophila persimilis]
MKAKGKPTTELFDMYWRGSDSIRCTTMDAPELKTIIAGDETPLLDGKRQILVGGQDYVY